MAVIMKGEVHQGCGIWHVILGVVPVDAAFA